MSTNLYEASVPVMKQMLGSLDALLAKALVHAQEKKFDVAVLLGARLYPDMFPLTRQVQIACDFARGVTARLAGVPVPTNDDHEQTVEELQALIARTLVSLDSLNAAQFVGSEEREIVIRPGTPKERRFTGKAYLFSYGIPQFFFHVTTAYALLRHNGVEVGKRDFMGNY